MRAARNARMDGHYDGARMVVVIVVDALPAVFTVRRTAEYGRIDARRSVALMRRHVMM